MSANGTEITYTLPIPGGHLDADYSGETFTADEVEWHTYVFLGDAFRLVRTRGTDTSGERSNRSRNLAFDEVPEWVPRPPSPWFFLANAIAATAEPKDGAS